MNTTYRHRAASTRIATAIRRSLPLAALLASGAVFASDPPPKPKADAHGEAKPADAKPADEAKPKS
mgnify:CR=1 FL=1